MVGKAVNVSSANSFERKLPLTHVNKVTIIRVYAYKVTALKRSTYDFGL